MKRKHGKKLGKHEALKIETYSQALRIAVRHGRKYGVTVDRAEDIASDAYLAQARGALRRLTARKPKALAKKVAFSGVADQLKRRMTREGGFAAGECFDFLDDPAKPFDITDLGLSAIHLRLTVDFGPDPVPPTPLWQRMVRDVLKKAPPDMRRIAKAYTSCWHDEEAREKVQMTPSKFYRLQKKLKNLLRPCFTAYRSWAERRGTILGR